MICKDILTTFLNEPCAHVFADRRFQVFLSNTNKSIYNWSIFGTHLNEYTYDS